MGDEDEAVVKAITERLSPLADKGVFTALPEEILKLALTLRSKGPRIVFPESGQSVGVALSNPKTAALCFDRVWASWEDEPPEVAVYTGTEEEVDFLSAYLVHGLILRLIEEWGSDDAMEPTTQEKIEKLDAIRNDIVMDMLVPAIAIEFETLDDKLGPMLSGESRSIQIDLEKVTEFIHGGHSRAIAAQLTSKHGVIAVPVFTGSLSMDNAYKAGDRSVLVASLEGLQIVDEASLEWKQVMAFRGDSNSVRKFRRLVHWLDKDMVGKSADFIEDEIGQRLEDYEWALRKHGISTVIGSASAALDSKSLLEAAATFGGLTLMGLEALAAWAAGVYVTGKCAVGIASKMLDHEDARRHAGAEIAYVYEAKHRLRSR